MKKSAVVPNDLMLDYRLHNWLRNKLASDPRRHFVKYLWYCGRGGTPDGVNILTNGVEAKAVGMQFCQSSWLCPVCTPRKMSKFAAKISCAIDALSHQGQAAFMITFTQFHTKSISCEDLFAIICEAYTNMIKKANWQRKRVVKGKKQVNNVTGEFYSSNGVWGNFIKEFNIRHSVKSLEVTYGEHGWHPHYHVLFFMDENRLQEINEWLPKLTDYWSKTLLKYQKKYITEEKYGNSAEIFFSLQKKYNNRIAKGEIYHQGCFISLNEDGSVHRVSSGNYVAGWGGEDELAGTPNLKTAQVGHFTPLELLYQAAIENDNDAWEKYMELALALHKHIRHRIDFGRNGINQIIRDWMKSNEYKEEIKKNITSLYKEGRLKKFKMVCWFTKEQWSNIWQIDTFDGYPLIYLILRFATYQDGYSLICELLEEFNLPPPLRQNPKYDMAEIFNQLIFKDCDVA